MLAVVGVLAASVQLTSAWACGWLANRVSRAATCRSTPVGVSSPVATTAPGMPSTKAAKETG